MNRRTFTVVLAYMLTIPAANWTLTHVGTPHPFGPRTIPVGFGYQAPSGVLWIGIALALRDAVQMLAGRWTTVGAIAAGSALTFAIAPSLAVASAVAFLVGELADFAVYTPLADRRLSLAVFASGAVGAVVDSLIFLNLAFGSVQFWQGNTLGKVWMSVLGIPLVWGVRRALSRDATDR